MSVYKEGFHALKLIETKSKRIYPDACDFGAVINVGDELWNWTKQLVDWYKVEGTRKVEKYSTGITVTQDVEVMDEWNTGDVFTYRVTYIGALKGEKIKTPAGKYDGIVSVELVKTVKGNKNLDN